MITHVPKLNKWYYLKKQFNSIAKGNLDSNSEYLYRISPSVCVHGGCQTQYRQSFFSVKFTLIGSVLQGLLSREGIHPTAVHPVHTNISVKHTPLVREYPLNSLGLLFIAIVLIFRYRSSCAIV